MTSDPHDRWLFLLALSALPLACTDDPPDDATTTTDSTSSTSDTPPITATTSDSSEGSTSIVTTGLDSTSSGDTTAGETSTGTDSTGSDGTTMAIEGTSTGESSSTTGEPLGLCELWGENLSACYGGYYNPAYYTSSCYDYLTSIDVMCGPSAAMLYQCQASGCFVDCSTEYETLDACNDLALAMQLGCDMIPDVPAVGTIDTQCVGVVDQAEVCIAAGYYIPGFSYGPEYAQYFCENGAFFTYFYLPPAMGDVCGGAYEELLTCLSALSCGDLEQAMFDDAYCTAQKNALTCRCELGA